MFKYSFRGLLIGIYSTQPRAPGRYLDTFLFSSYNSPAICFFKQATIQSRRGGYLPTKSSNNSNRKYILVIVVVVEVLVAVVVLSFYLTTCLVVYKYLLAKFYFFIYFVQLFLFAHKQFHISTCHTLLAAIRNYFFIQIPCALLPTLTIHMHY